MRAQEVPGPIDILSIRQSSILIKASEPAAQAKGATRPCSRCGLLAGEWNDMMPSCSFAPVPTTLQRAEYNIRMKVRRTITSTPEIEGLPYLETFSKAAELSSFTAAAESQCLTQAAVSQRIQVLEKSLGKSLFARRGGRVVLTQSGRSLYEYAQRILDLHRLARCEISGDDAPVGGELPIAASTVPGEHLLPDMLLKFRARYPHIQVRATIGDSKAVIAQVERGEANLGLAGQKADQKHLDSRFLAKDRMVLVMAPGHALSRRKSVASKDLFKQPIILREAGSGLRQCFEKSLERAGLSLGQFKIALELGSNEGIKQAVRRGLGVGVLSSLAVQKEIETGELHVAEFADLSCQRDMFVIQDRRRVLPLPARLFLAVLDAHHPLPAMS